MDGFACMMQNTCNNCVFLLFIIHLISIPSVHKSLQLLAYQHTDINESLLPLYQIIFLFRILLFIDRQKL
jgi:hypothetical protein